MEQENERIYTHRIINYIQASYQGRFAMLNILSQTGHPLFKAEELTKTQNILQELHEWHDGLLKGSLFFPIREIKNPSGIHKQALTYLASIKPELESIAKKVKEILVGKTQNNDHKQAYLLMATLGRHAYCRDNYIRGIVRYADSIGDQMLAKNYRLYLDNAKELLEEVNEGISILQKNDNILSAPQLDYLAFLARTIPGTFRAHIHDINQLLLGPTKEINFEQAGFLKLEADAWKAAGFTALEAGYWRAHEIGINEALSWIENEIVDPALVGDWKTANFPPEVAIEWIKVLFQPSSALHWANAGYSARDARILVMSGIAVPEEVPASELQEILSEGYAKLANLTSQAE